MIYDVIIVGGGPGGLTAAIYTCRAGLKTVLLEMGAPGGQAATTDMIDNYPGFPEGVAGPDLMMNFYNQAARFGCEFRTAEVTGVSDKGGVRLVETAQGNIEGKTVIIATGASPRGLGVKGEQEFRGRGVSFCATCDGFFFKDKSVVVVGGGDSAVKEAIYLSKLAGSVTIIHRRDEFRAAEVLSDKVKDIGNIRVIWDSVVDEIIGSGRLEKVAIHNIKTQESSEIGADGVFLYVGTQPNTAFLDGAFSRNAQGYLLADEKLQTSVKGVFAVGDCRAKLSRQVASAVGDGASVLAAIEESSLT